LLQKRDDALCEKYEEAETLRTNIEKRGRQAMVQVQGQLTTDEHGDFERYVNTLPALLLRQAELEEKMRLGTMEKDVLIRVFDDDRVDVDV
jgi:hypothetical protein